MNKITAFLLILPFASMGKSHSNSVQNDSTQVINTSSESLIISNESDPILPTPSQIEIETFSSDSKSFLIKGISKLQNLQLIDLTGQRVYFDMQIDGDKMVITPHHFNNVKENFILFISDQKGNTVIKRVDMP